MVLQIFDDDRRLDHGPLAIEDEREHAERRMPLELRGIIRGPRPFDIRTASRPPTGRSRLSGCRTKRDDRRTASSPGTCLHRFLAALLLASRRRLRPKLPASTSPAGSYVTIKLPRCRSPGDRPSSSQRRRSFAEYPLSRAQQDREGHQGQPVDQSGLEQLRVKRAAALDDEVGAVALLDLCQCAEIADADGYFPIPAAASRGSRHIWCSD